METTMASLSHPTSMSLTIEQGVEIILLCGREGTTNKSVAETFIVKHEGRNVSHITACHLLVKLKETGSVHEKK